MKCSAAPEADAAHAPGIERKIPLAERAAAAFDLLADTGEAVGLAVSGGSDSLALLHLAIDWAHASGRRLAVATVDHGLRPEAAAEADAVARICAQLDVGHAVLRWRPEGQAAQNVSQNDARRARHQLLADWARDKGLSVLAIGHTQDDRIETFLIRARAGSGWWGLAAPPPSSASPVDTRLRIVRPLLAFSRQDLRHALVERGVQWIDDPSNAAERFERVRMRALAACLPPATRASLLRTVDRFARLRAAVTAEARAMLDRAAIDSARIQFDLTALASLGDVARLRLLEAAVIAAGSGKSPPPLASLEKLSGAFAAGRHPPALNVGGALLHPVRGPEGASVLVVEPEPRRRPATRGEPGVPARPAPGWDRLSALLAEPRLDALGV